MPDKVSRHKIDITLFEKTPALMAGRRKDECQYSAYVELLTGEYVQPCTVSVALCGNVSVRMGANEPWTDFSVCDHHSEQIEKRLSEDPEAEDGAVVGAGEVEAEVANGRAN